MLKNMNWTRSFSACTAKRTCNFVLRQPVMRRTKMVQYTDSKTPAFPLQFAADNIAQNIHAVSPSEALEYVQADRAVIKSYRRGNKSGSQLSASASARMSLMSASSCSETLLRTWVALGPRGMYRDALAAPNEKVAESKGTAKVTEDINRTEQGEDGMFLAMVPKEYEEIFTIKIEHGHEVPYLDTASYLLEKIRVELRESGTWNMAEHEALEAEVKAMVMWPIGAVWADNQKTTSFESQSDSEGNSDYDREYDSDYDYDSCEDECDKPSDIMRWD